MALVSIISCVSLRRVTARKERDPTDDSPNLFLLENPNLTAEERKGHGSLLRRSVGKKRGREEGGRNIRVLPFPPFFPRLPRERGC